MKNKKVVMTLIIVATVVLGGIAVFTAVRLFQLRQQAVAPTAPERPSAQVLDDTLVSCNPLSFSYGEEDGGETDPPNATDPPATDPPATDPPATDTPEPTSTPEGGGGTGGGTSDTPAPSALPDAGIPTPTLIGSAAGLLLILFSLMLAL